MKALLPDLVLVHGPHIVVVMVTVVTMVTVVRLLEVAEVGCVDVGLGHGAGAVPGAGPRPLGVSLGPEKNRHVFLPKRPTPFFLVAFLSSKSNFAGLT